MGALTRLQAVNRMLRAASEYPVNSLSDDGINDTAIAESLLDETVIEVQAEGFNANTEVKTLHPNTTGRIVLPDNTLDVDSVGEDCHRNLTYRGKNPVYLYDNDNNTHVFDASVEVRITVGLTFEELPTLHQFHVVDLAAKRYQDQTVGDSAAARGLAETAFMSRTMSRAADIASRDANLLTSSANAWRIVNRWFNGRRNRLEDYRS